MLSNNFKSKVSSVVSSSYSLDMTSKELFLVAHNEFIKVSSEHIKSLNKEINQYLSDTIKSDTVRAGIKRVVNVARKYSELKAITYVDRLSYDNIKGVVTLLHYIDSNYEDKAVLKRVKNKLSRVKNDHNYNNSFRTKLIELRNEYKIVVTEEGNVIKLSGNQVVSTVKDNLDKLSDEQRAELIALLQADNEQVA